MKNLVGFLSLSIFLVLGVAAGCGDDDDGGDNGGAGTSAAGSGGSAGSSAGSGGSAGSSAGSGGSAGSSAGSGGAAGSSAGSAGSAGEGQGGSAGSSGGSGGSAGSASSEEVGGCTIDKAVDKTAGDTEVLVGPGFEYTPRCTKIKKGAKVAFKGNSDIHPLQGMSANGTQPNPIGGPHKADQTVTFDGAGSFGFYCTVHGGDGKTSGESGMAGAIFVVE